MYGSRADTVPFASFITVSEYAGTEAAKRGRDYIHREYTNLAAVRQKPEANSDQYPG